MTFDEYLAKKMENPTWKRKYDALEGWYQEALHQQEALNGKKSKKHIAHPYKKRPLAAV